MQTALLDPVHIGRMTIAYFGTGLLGAGFVRRLLDNGHTVHVWNRSPEKAKALEADGAIAFASAADAVEGAEQLHLTLADDASVDAVLEPLADTIDAGTWIVDHTTTAPTPTIERIARWKARGKRYVHAPVFMGPANSREGTGLMLISGDAADVAALQPQLATMTGKLVNLGVEPGRAAAFKLFGNLMLITIMGGFADVNRLAGATGITTADAMALFNEFNPGMAVPARSAKLASGDFTPSFEVEMARKDLRLMIDEAAHHGVELAVVPAVAALFDATIARGDGKLDGIAVAKRIA
jgi:3-hydroxyisobutyrate dehydrogenase